MIITDEKTKNQPHPYRYKLSASRLTALDGYPFIVTFKDIRKHEGRSAQLFVKPFTPGPLLGSDHYIRVTIGKNSIGCRDFSTKNMRLIRKAIRGTK
jgi:hypothetical protein